MKKSLSVVYLWLLVVTTLFAQPLFAEESQLVVSATGTVLAKPDMAEFGVVLKSDAETADQAASECAGRYRVVQRALRTAGVATDDSPSANYTVSPLLEWEQSTGKNIMKGYSARHTIMVKVRNLALIGRIIDGVVKAGADEVQGIRFFSSRYDALRQQAVALALGNAHSDALVMARAAGGSVGQLIEVSLMQPSFVGGRPMELMAMRAAPVAAPTEIAPADQEITVTITSRWRFIPSSVK